VSRSPLLAFVLGIACGIGLAWLGGALRMPASTDAASAREAPAAALSRPLASAPSAQGLPVSSAPPAAAPGGAEPSAEDPDASGGVVERESEGEPVSMVISTALFQEAQARAERVRETLANLPEDAPLGYQLEAYTNALKDNLGNLPIPEFAEKKDMLAEAFLWTDSVQKQFAAMSPSNRQTELNFIRRELGYTDAEVKELARRDAARDARWQNGLVYTKERHRAAANLDGETLRKELDRLRERYFGAEAATIAAEERDGFFRYETPRIYGRN